MKEADETSMPFYSRQSSSPQPSPSEFKIMHSAPTEFLASEGSIDNDSNASVIDEGDTESQQHSPSSSADQEQHNQGIRTKRTYSKMESSPRIPASMRALTNISNGNCNSDATSDEDDGNRNEVSSLSRSTTSSASSAISDTGIEDSPKPNDATLVNDDAIEIELDEEYEDGEVPEASLNGNNELSHEDRKELIRSLIKTELKLGDNYYLIPSDWWREFIHSRDGYHLSQLSSLELARKFHMRVVQSHEYKTVPETVWQILGKWYREVGAPITRQVIRTDEGKLIIEDDKYMLNIRILEGFEFPQLPIKEYQVLTSFNMTMHGLLTILEKSYAAVEFNSDELDVQVWRISRTKFATADSISDANYITLEEFHSFDPTMISDYSKSLLAYDFNPRDLLILEFKKTLHSTWMSSKRPRKNIGTMGLSNLGNSCYMNSALQCLLHVEELACYFLSQKYRNDINVDNPIGCGGHVANAYAKLLENTLGDPSGRSYSPREFKHTVGRYNNAFSGYEQQDSQEFLAFLLDALHEDLNKILKKPATEKPELADDQIHNEEAIQKLADDCWEMHKRRNDSVVLDLFTGLYRSVLVCPVCDKVSVTFDPFMDLTLPLPVDNTWIKEVLIYPAVGEIKKFSIGIDRNSTVLQMKQYVSERLGLNVKRLISAEIFNHQYYRQHEDTDIVSAVMSAEDTIVLDELDRDVSVDQREEETEEGEEEKIISVPVFHRRKSFGDEEVRPVPVRFNQSPLFGYPFYITLSESEAKDGHKIKEIIERRYTSLYELDLESEQQRQEQLPELESEQQQTESQTESQRNSEELDFEMNYIEKSKSSLSSKFTISSNNAHPFSNRMAVRIEKPETIVSPMEVEENNNNTTTDNSDNDDVMEIVQSSPETLPSPDVESFEPMEADSEEGPESEGDLAMEPVLVDEPRKVEAWLEVDNDKPSDEEEEEDVMIGSFLEHVEQQQPDVITTTEEVVGNDGRLVYDGEGIVCDFTKVNSQKIEIHLPTPVENRELNELKKQVEIKKNQGVKLDDCLDLFSKTEVLGEDDLWYCSRCRELRQATKTIELWKTPDIFTIHLKRFSSFRSFRDKIEDVVYFPIEGLDMSRRVINNNCEELIYDLFAVDHHSGGLGGGHYTATVKNFIDDKWYYFNDSFVNPADPQNAISGTAYLLFYKRRSDKPLGTKEIIEAVEVMREREYVTVDDGMIKGSNAYGASSFIHDASPFTTSTGGYQSIASPPRFSGPGRILRSSDEEYGTRLPWATATLNVGPSNSALPSSFLHRESDEEINVDSADEEAEFDDVSSTKINSDKSGDEFEL